MQRQIKRTGRAEVGHVFAGTHFGGVDLVGGFAHAKVQRGAGAHLPAQAQIKQGVGGPVQGVGRVGINLADVAQACAGFERGGDAVR